MSSHLNPDGTVNLDEPSEPDDELAHLDPAAIANCTLCDTDGYRNLVVCDHIDHTAETPGRAAFHAEMAKLRARRVEKASVCLWRWGLYISIRGQETPE